MLDNWAMIQSRLATAYDQRDHDEVERLLGERSGCVTSLLQAAAEPMATPSSNFTLTEHDREVERLWAEERKLNARMRVPCSAEAVDAKRLRAQQRKLAAARQREAIRQYKARLTRFQPLHTPRPEDNFLLKLDNQGHYGYLLTLPPGGASHQADDTFAATAEPRLRAAGYRGDLDFIPVAADIYKSGFTLMAQSIAARGGRLVMLHEWCSLVRLTVAPEPKPELYGQPTAIYDCYLRIVRLSEPFRLPDYAAKGSR